MTASEMLILFRERYNNSSNVNDDKEDEELYLYLNSATNRFIKQRFTGNNVRGIPFEGDPKRMDDLRTLIKKSSALVTTGTISEISNGRKYTVPADFMFLIKGFISIDSNWFSAERITIDESYEFIETIINKPIIREGKIFYDNSTEFVVLVDPDNFADFTTCIVQYIKTPAVIASGTNCDLPNHTHEEIVEIAVGLAIDGVENLERFQTHSEKLKMIE